MRATKRRSDEATKGGFARRLGAAVLATIVLSVVAGGRQDPASLVQQPAWVERLEALHPGRPMDYFELAEEVADRAESDPDRLLSRRLFGLSGVLDPSRLAPSACLALADLEEREHAKRRLRALAMLLSERSGIDWPADEGLRMDAVRSGAALAVADAIAYYRRGLGSRSVAALRRPGAMELLRSIDHLLPGGVDRFLEDCRVYRAGQVKPQLTEDETTLLIRVEAAILAGPEQRWSGQLLLHGGQPLIEVDPERLAEMLGVDPARPFFRRGRWASQQGRPAAEH